MHSRASRPSFYTGAAAHFTIGPAEQLCACAKPEPAPPIISSTFVMATSKLQQSRGWRREVLLATSLLWLCPAASLSCSRSCSLQVTVDPGISETASCTVRNATCSSLQAALEAISVTSGIPRDDCIAVRLLPGTHVITESVTIRQNLVLCGLEISDSLSPPTNADVPGSDQVSPTHTDTHVDLRRELSLSPLSLSLLPPLTRLSRHH